jgi:ribonuclease III
MNAPPWNSVNKLMSLDDVADFLGKYGVTKRPKQLAYYQCALTHKSYALEKKAVRVLTFDTAAPQAAPEDGDDVAMDFPEEVVERYRHCVRIQATSYERLELLGDAVLGMVVADYLYTRYPDQDEGFLTRTRSDLVCKTALAKLNTTIGLGEFVLLSDHVEHTVGRGNTNILEDTLEAFIGAIYKDLGIVATRAFVVNLVEREINMTDVILNDTNYKDILLRYYQQLDWNHPKYVLANADGPAHHRIFTVLVHDPKGRQVGFGRATSKKLAEQEASKHALYHFGVLKRRLAHPAAPP